MSEETISPGLRVMLMTLRQAALMVVAGIEAFLGIKPAKRREQTGS